MRPGEYVDALAERAAALLAAARMLPETPIPSCPGWDMRDLVAHVGSTWGWAAEIVRTKARADTPTAPEGTAADVVAWAERLAIELVAVLRAADPDADCWTFGPPRTALFWMRRQALETAVHAWDAERAVAHPEPVVADLAADGVDEFLAVFLPRILRLRPDGWRGQSVGLVDTGTTRQWRVTLGPEGAVETGGEAGRADVVLRGPTSDLYLWCMNRVDTVDLDVAGDRTVADQWTNQLTF